MEKSILAPRNSIEAVAPASPAAIGMRDKTRTNAEPVSL